MTNRSIEVELKRDASGEVEVARIRFGPHYSAEVKKEAGRVSFALVATHHGFAADASEVDGELEHIIEDVRRGHPSAAVD